MKIDVNSPNYITPKEIEHVIRKNLSRIKRLKERIDDAKFDIKATRKSVAFWKRELKKTLAAEKRGGK